MLGRHQPEPQHIRDQHSTAGVTIAQHSTAYHTTLQQRVITSTAHSGMHDCQMPAHLFAVFFEHPDLAHSAGHFLPEDVANNGHDVSSHGDPAWSAHHLQCHPPSFLRATPTLYHHAPPCLECFCVRDQTLEHSFGGPTGSNAHSLTSCIPSCTSMLGCSMLGTEPLDTDTLLCSAEVAPQAVAQQSCSSRAE